MSKIISIGIMALIALGVIFIIRQWLGWIDWPWYWVMSPIFLAVVIYVIVVILTVVFGIEIS